MVEAAEGKIEYTFVRDTEKKNYIGEQGERGESEY